jgi:hypothetical protein
MIDLFSLLVSHALILLACWRLVRNPALDRERPSDYGAADRKAGDADA